MQTGIANVPLHSGQCPSWLSEKMKQLSATMVEVNELAALQGNSRCLTWLSMIIRALGKRQ
ncbi:MAG: DUF763 domain-containing protein [Clostridiaceae bacterium]|jgi:hypothetical protein|nr:DUF763 domain-containing protein [Clostridiaceae bacterium]